jgi:DNA-binding IclR family transcriptional regulator
MTSSDDLAARRGLAGLTSADDRSVLNRAFRIMAAFDGDGAELSLTDLAERTGLPKPSLHRLAAQLIEQGALERTRYGYQLGMRIFEMGGLVPRQRRLRDIALPYIEDLYEATHQTVHFAILDGRDVVYLERIFGSGSMPLPTRVGGRLPAYCSAVGKAMLAFSPEPVVENLLESGLRRRTPNTITNSQMLLQNLTRIRNEGVAYDREEGKQGVACVAAPILNNERRPVAALSITTRTPEMHSRLTPAIKATGRSLARAVRMMPDSYWDRRRLVTEIE